MFIKTRLSLIIFKIIKFNVVLLFIINIQYKVWSSYIDACKNSSSAVYALVN